jgi:hypothetical protein
MRQVMLTVSASSPDEAQQKHNADMLASCLSKSIGLHLIYRTYGNLLFIWHSSAKTRMAS